MLERRKGGGRYMVFGEKDERRIKGRRELKVGGQENHIMVARMAKEGQGLNSTELESENHKEGGGNEEDRKNSLEWD